MGAPDAFTALDGEEKLVHDVLAEYGAVVRRAVLATRP